MEAIFTRLEKVVWNEHFGDVPRNQTLTPIFANLLTNTWERSWEDQHAKVQACRQVRVQGRMEE